MLRRSAATDRYALRCPGTMLSSLACLALLACVQGRAVNISNTWVLPEEGFPVFYRYFRDRISWYEADAVCQFHHANLVTVDTTAQYDAVRAYLKELDISSAVWVGLIRSNPDGDFTWTDYRELSGDGYWRTAPDSRSAPLCAAADPAADYRWEARACGGPTVASFICELPVPQWALGNEGCMVRELPALTILYLPESAAVQLNADCGLAGVKRVECTGNVKREGILKDLTCADEEEMSSTSTQTSTGANWPAITDLTTDIETTSEVTTEENITTEHDIKQPIVIAATLLPHYLTSKSQYTSSKKFTDMDNFNTVTFRKDVNLGSNDDQNIESNFIPKMIDEGNMLTNEQLEKLEDERHMQHKMLHEEIARVGNVDNIFTQPTDHFIPPLVMAKSRMSDDMTVLSLAEKHAQQLAEKQFSKHIQSNHRYFESHNDKPRLDYTYKDKTLITLIKPNKLHDAKKDILKTHVPKKYFNEKYYDVKGKVAKSLESKATLQDKFMETTQTTAITQGNSKATALKNYPQILDKIDEDFAMDLKVMLKDASLTSSEQMLKSVQKDANDSDNIEATTNKPTLNTVKVDHDLTLETSSSVSDKPADNSSIEHQVIQITVLSDDDPAINTTTFEITTKMPIFRDDIDKLSTYSTSLSTEAPKETEQLEDIIVTSEKTLKVNNTVSLISGETSTAFVTYSHHSAATPTENPIQIVANSTTKHSFETGATEPVSTIKPILESKTELTEIPTTMGTTVFLNITDIIDKNTTETNLNVDTFNISTSHAPIEKLDFNHTEIHDLFEKNITDTEEIIDDNSPLLSGAYEPIQRPPRTRRPQQPNRKFNPFRILG